MNLKPALLVVAWGLWPADLRADPAAGGHAITDPAGAAAALSKPGAAARPLPPVLADADDAAPGSRLLVVALREGAAPGSVAEAHGLTVHRVLRSDTASFVAKVPDVVRPDDARRRLAGDPLVRWVAYDRPAPHVRSSFVPNDPYFRTGNPPGWPGQWHLVYEARPELDANVEGAWARGLTGAGVILGICDDGLERAHPDLSPGYVAANSFDFADRDPNPDPVRLGRGPEGDNHGTSVAGVAGARGGNGLGVTGAAPLARLAGLRLPFGGTGMLSDFVDATKYHSFGSNRSIRVKNHSYGIGVPFVATDAERAALADSAEAGTLHVVSAGNDRGTAAEDSNKKSLQASPHAITVAALSSTGVFASYSCFGANVFVTAPSNSFRAGEFGVTTTDRTGEPGYNGSPDAFPDKDYEPDFGGTSSAAPVVAGVLALAVQANPAMTPRLAKHLLARSCDVVDAADATPASDGGWKTNAAGFRFNQNYGFGLIDADECTRLAVQFTGVSPLQLEETPGVAVATGIPDRGELSRAVPVTRTTPLEEVEVFLDFTHARRGDLEATLRSPRGTETRLFRRLTGGADATGGRTAWWFTCNAFWGENPAGSWTVTLKDTVSGAVGTWNGFRMRCRMGTPIGLVVPPPVLTTVSPGSGPAGTAVTLDGDKLNTVTSVTFNGAESGFTIESGTRLRATVPLSATTGPVRVTTPGGVASSASDFVVTAVPQIASLVPVSGGPGSAVVVTGANLAGATAVRFNGVLATFTVTSATALTALVPAGAATGRVAVTTPTGTATSTTNFTATAQPAVTALTPAQGTPGTLVTVTGTNFVGVTAVRFNGVGAASFTVVEATRLQAVVPAGAVSGPVAVVTASGTATSAQPFTVVPAPVVTHLTPESGPDGTLVTVTGEHFEGVTAVTFNGVAAVAYDVDSARQLRATAPVGVTSGPVRVTTPAGTGVSARPFLASPRPPNDGFAAALPLDGGAGTLSGTNAGATREAGELNHAGLVGGKSVWFRWTAPVAGTVVMDTAGSEFDTVLGVYTGSTVGGLTLVMANDDAGDLMPSQRRTSLVSFAVSAGVEYRVVLDGYNETSVPGSAASGSWVLNWRSAAAPVVAGFNPAAGPVGSQVTVTGSHLAGATAILFNGTPAAVFSAGAEDTVTAVVPAGATTGPLAVVTPAGTGSSARTFALSTPPSNDSLAAAQPLSGASGSATATNRAATAEPGEPAHAGVAGGASVWFSWTAPQAGRFVFDTLGSDFDTLLAVYRGAGMAELVLVAANQDQAPGSRASRVAFDAVGGVVYRLAVDGWAGAQGTVALNWRSEPAPVVTTFTPDQGPVGTQVRVLGAEFTDVASVRIGETEAAFSVISASELTLTVPAGATGGPVSVTASAGQATSGAVFRVLGVMANDFLAGARELTGPVVVFDNNSLATREAGEPDHAGVPGGRSVWFRWTAPTSGRWMLGTWDSGFDTTLAVYTGTTMAGLTPVATNDDGPEGAASIVELEAVAGVQYAVAVDGYRGAFGSIVLTVHPAPAADTLLSARFELQEGYAPNVPLAGQRNWNAAAAGGNGVAAGLLAGEGQSAFVGFSPLEGEAPGQLLWVPLNHTPSAARPVVRFSTTLAVADSTDWFYDDFEFRVYNSANQMLAGVNFDNTNLGVYIHDGSPPYSDTGLLFENETPYTLEVLMDFAAGRWSAWLDGVPIADRRPLGAAGQTRDLADIDVGWIPRDVVPGDNFLVFDNFLVRSEGSPAPVVVVPPRDFTVAVGEPVQLGAAATGSPPLTYQWHHQGFPIPGATGRLLALPAAQLADSGTYHVTVTNTFGSTASPTATLTVQPTVATGFAAWAAGYFGAGAPVIVAGPPADPDGDSLDNLTEYALGTDPTRPVSAGLRVTIVNGRLAAEVDRAGSRPDIDYAVEASSSLAPGSWRRLEAALDTPTRLRAVDTVTTADGTQRWLRLRLSLR